MEIRPATDPLFREVYGEFAPTMKSILPHDFGRILRNPDSIMLFGARHMMSEEVEKLDDLTLLGYAVATGNGVRLDNDSAQKLVHALQQLENFGDNFLGVTSADFGLKFIRGTNTLDIIFELVTPSVTIASQARRHNDRRAASPTLMAVACKLAEAHLFEDQHLQRKIEIFRSSNKFLDTLSEPARDARGPRNGSE